MEVFNITFQNKKMNPENRRPILYKGERYNQIIPKTMGGKAKEPKQSYDQAREKIVSDIQKTRGVLSSTPSGFVMPNEFILSIKIDPDFSAKSYYPGNLFEPNPQKSGLQEVGSRVWRDSENSESGKIFFVRTTNRGLDLFERSLRNGEAGVKKGFAIDVRKVKSLDILDPKDQILLPPDWKEGRVEAVLHPFLKDQDVAFSKFMNLLKDSGVNMNRVNYKKYELGVTFISLPANKKIIEQLAGYNPLRTIHPLSLRSNPINRRLVPDSAPLPPIDTQKPKVTLGIFDGGIHLDNAYTSPYTEAVNLTTSTPDPDCVDHGTLVTGAALYGAINKYGKKDTLPKPAIAVRNFRVTPTMNEDDMDMYEVIDAIENTVPTQEDISVYNLSIGPYGPILDDHISRFTFACDILASKHNVLFCTAVGNIGDHDIEYMRRIQSPSDMVNGIAVGAYTKIDGNILHAPYSCLGPGREGNKLKPDLVAFGGCDNTPLHLIPTQAGGKDAVNGTSFTSPMVASFASQLVGYSGGAINPLVARGMLIHTSNSMTEAGHDNEFGHGLLANSVEDIVTCIKNSFTLIYQGELEFGKFTQFKIPWINGIEKGKVKFRWTSVVTSEIDPCSPDDYTSGSTLVSFYPHANKYKFTKAGKTKTLDLNKPEDALQVEELERDGWEKNSFPSSVAGVKSYASEEELRADMKWDTTDCRSESKITDSIFDPFFHIHALRRGHRNKNRKIKFALIVSVELSDENIDLYSKIVSAFDLLVPIQLDVSLAVQVKT